jgi:hypothetical protein
MTSVTTPVSGQREPELAGQTVVVIGGPEAGEATGEIGKFLRARVR